MFSLMLSCTSGSDSDGCTSCSCFFFAFMGVASAIIFSNLGSAYGTAKSGVGISSMGVMNPQMVMRNMIPIIMAGVLPIYGLIIAIILAGSISLSDSFNEYYGYAYLAAGLAVGLSGLASGLSIGIAGDAGVRANGQQPRLYVGMILILIFGEAIGLYGLIVGIILSQA